MGEVIEFVKSQALDVKLLGQKFPGSPRERLILLNDLEDMVRQHGEDWVRNSRERLLWEAQYTVDQGVL